MQSESQPLHREFTRVHSRSAQPFADVAELAKVDRENEVSDGVRHILILAFGTYHLQAKQAHRIKGHDFHNLASQVIRKGYITQ